MENPVESLVELLNNQLVEHSLPERKVVGLNPGCTISKGVKNDTCSSVPDAHIIGVVLGR